MFVPYALAGGMALALLALFCEIGCHFRWSVLRKWVGGFTVVAVTMGVVPQIANEFSQLAVAAVCSCLVLALSARGYQEVTRASKETEPVLPSSVSSLYMEEQPQAAREELQAEVQEELQEEVHIETHPPDVFVAPEAEVEAEVDPEWLNAQIAAGYQAKAAGELLEALEAFESAAAACRDGELVEMLKDEVVECALLIKLGKELDMIAS